MISLGAIAVLAAQFTVPLKVCEGNSLQLVGCRVEGRPCMLIFDTGASHTTLDIDFVTNAIPDAALHEVELAGSTNVAMAPKVMFTKSVRVGAIDFADYPVMVLPMSTCPRPDGRRPAGILGMDLIGKLPVVLSLKDECVIFNPENLDGFGPVLEMDRRDFDGSPRLLFESGGKVHTMLVDSGSSLTFVTPASGWPVAEGGEAGDWHARSINGGESLSVRPGEKGKLKLKRADGEWLEMELAPLVNSSMPYAYFGADTLRNFDLYLNLPEIRLRPR